jgi:hypothetical protein
MQGFSTRLYTNLLLTNLIKDILHYINIVLPLTTYSSARSTFIKILVSFGFTTRIFFRKQGSIPNYRKAKLENRVERYMELTILVLSRANAPHHTSSFYIVQIIDPLKPTGLENIRITCPSKPPTSFSFPFSLASSCFLVY